MAASETLGVPGDSAAAAVDPMAAAVPAVPGPGVASRRFPQLIPIAQVLVIVLGVLAIVWNEQQSNHNLRTDMRADIADVRAEIKGLETTLRDEINGSETTLRDEIGELRDEVVANGQRLARIEGFLGIGTPDTAAE